MAKPKRTVVEYRSYSLSSQFPLQLLTGDYWRISDIPSDRLHFHNCLEIGICHSDGGSLVIFDEIIPFRAGDVTVIPKNVPHTTYSSPGTESLWSYIFFDAREMFRGMLPLEWKNGNLFRQAYRGMQVVFGKEEYPQLHQLALAAIRELKEEKANYQLSAKGLLLALCIEITRALSPLAAGREGSGSAFPGQADYGKYPPWSAGVLPGSGFSDQDRASGMYNALLIAPALDYIEQNYSEDFSMEYLAELCHWSPTHFRRVFHDTMRISPLDFLNYTRIANACNLLQSTENPILDISEAVGFHSVSSFNRCFTKIMQMSPREYRKTTQHPMNTDSQYIVGYSGWMRPEVPKKE